MESVVLKIELDRETKAAIDGLAYSVRRAEAFLDGSSPRFPDLQTRISSLEFQVKSLISAAAKVVEVSP